ncbi:MAG: hypothetical protein HY287_15490 [Planctomycetes bacterium]|nr:hypothetical protein [Planctomycetota bacterium]MBI3835728.1 hypothetical protein [Planctomycetota bacterium]
MMSRRLGAAGPRRGIILTDTCISLALIGLVLGMASLLLTRHAVATDYFVNYRRAQLAAESCVERMRFGMVAIENARIVDDAGIAFEIQIVDAEESWRPLLRVNVTATAIGKHGRAARYSLGAYIAPLQRSGP